MALLGYKWAFLWPLLIVTVRFCRSEDLTESCYPELRTVPELTQEKVIHYRIKSSGNAVPSQVFEDFNKTKIEEYFPLTCRPKCIPRCGAHAYCQRMRGVRNKCICLDGYQAKHLPPFGIRCDPICKAHCGLNTMCKQPGPCICKHGYRRSLKDDLNCDPICEMSCGPFQECVSPNQCGCKDGYKMHADGLCHPLCEQHRCGDFEKCIEPESCECITGYTRVGGKCQPQCPLGCALNKYCAKPEVCLCKAGYIEANTGVCRPVCSNECGENEECKSPEKCGCLKGYARNSTTGTCEAICKKPTCPAHSVCVRPEECECQGGYTMTKNGACEPICYQCGAHTQCLSPGQCQCLTGYHRSTSANSADCQPTCPKGCGPHASCIKPTECACDLGYKMNSTSACVPICAPECELHSFCISPGICSCREGFKGEGNHCEPKCSPACGDNSYCSKPDKCECISGFTPDDVHNRNCSSMHSVWILILIAGAGVVAILALASCTAFLCSRRTKEPSYVSQHNETTDMHNVDLSECNTAVGGINNEGFI